MSEYNSTLSGEQASSSQDAERRPGGDSEPATDRFPEVERPTEYGGRKKGREPTRYGDWEKDGRCIDF